MSERLDLSGIKVLLPFGKKEYQVLNRSDIHGGHLPTTEQVLTEALRAQRSEDWYALREKEMRNDMAVISTNNTALRERVRVMELLVESYKMQVAHFEKAREKC